MKSHVYKVSFVILSLFGVSVASFAESENVVIIQGQETPGINPYSLHIKGHKYPCNEGKCPYTPTPDVDFPDVVFHYIPSNPGEMSEQHRSLPCANAGIIANGGTIIATLTIEKDVGGHNYNACMLRHHE